MELLQNVVGTMRFPGPDDDPVPFAADPTVTITRHSDGSAIVTDEATTKVEEEGEDPFYTVDLTGEDLSEVDLLVAVWTDGASSYTTYAEVVGGFVVSLKAIEAKYGEAGKSPNEYAGMREIATRSIEGACGVAFRPRYGKDVLDGSGTRNLLLRQPQLLRLLSVAIDGEELSEEEIGALTLDPAGLLIRTGGWTEGQANVEVAYVHGYEGFSPAALPVRDLAAHLLTQAPTDWNERATAVQTEMGSYSLVTAGVRGASFPLPSVNAFVEEHRFRSIG